MLHPVSSFMIYSNHEALKTEFEKSDRHGLLITYLDLTAEYEFRIRHVHGSRSVIANYLSRCLEDSSDTKEGNRFSIEKFLNRIIV